ncbi:MAG: SDR family NAD(P)-dependent oxidoreductase [Parvibaculum sp.]|uniref:SDR family NAD(P)-dependent oxidoreductase n=1 Tax=Parvibaculum sp. TaxID=2024848 RepID=UPI003C724FFA
MTRTALIIGATGGIGSETALALAARGWRIRALNRNPQKAARDFAWLGPVEWVKGDAMNVADVVAAARGVNLLVHGANPPGYRNWKGTALPMLESSIAAAMEANARIVFPGTVYNFGPETFPRIDERAPQRPRTRKGAIRVAMETRLREASAHGLRVLIVRAGDFFGPRGGNNWFGQGLVKAGKPFRSITYPGRREVGHNWAFLPDLAETIVRLVEREKDLGGFEVFHFGGHWFERGVEIAEAARRAAGVPDAPIRRFPWLAVWLASPFVETFREMLEMRYLWKRPLRLDNGKLVAFLGEEPHTPAEQALRVTLKGLGCLDVQPRAAGLSAPRLQGRL